MTPDPVVLRHDDPIAIAIHKMAVGGFRHIPITRGRPADRGRHRARRLPPPRGDDRLTARVAVLADDLIWATRLADLVRGAGAEPVAVRSLAALEAALPDVDGVVVDLTARAYDGIEAAEVARAAQRAASSRSASTTTSSSDGGRWPPAPIVSRRTGA